MGNQVVDLQKERAGKLQLILLPGHTVPPELREYHDNAYRLWRKVWESTFQELKTDATVRADNFVRQEIISALFLGKQAVGLILYSLFDLELVAVREHSYLETYPPELVSRLRDDGVHGVLSMEYLSLDPDWRVALDGAPLSKIMIGIAPKVFEWSGADAAVAVTRNEKKVNEALYGFGARCLRTNLTKHNVAVDIVAFRKGDPRPSGDPHVDGRIESLWAGRIDALDRSGKRAA